MKVAGVSVLDPACEVVTMPTATVPIAIPATTPPVAMTIFMASADAISLKTSLHRGYPNGEKRQPTPSSARRTAPHTWMNVWAGKNSGGSSIPTSRGIDPIALLNRSTACSDSNTSTTQKPPFACPVA